MRKQSQSDYDSKICNPSVAKPELDTHIILTLDPVPDMWNMDSVFASASLFAYKILGRNVTAMYL